MNAHPPTLVLERFLRKEDLGASAEWRSHLEGCPECGAQLERMRTEDAAYRDRPAAAQLRESLGARRSGPASTPWRLGRRVAFLLFPAAAVAGAALLWQRPASDGSLIAKGGGLEVTLQRGSTVGPLGAVPLQAGDLLQLSWSSPTGGYVAVFAKEADGSVEQIYPRGALAAPVPTGPHQPLGGSLSVDGKNLVLHAFFASEPFSLAGLEGPLRRGEIPSLKGLHRILDLPGTVGP